MTLTLTRPLLSWPHLLTATNHLRVVYSDASTQNVSLPAGTYYPDGGTGGLLAIIQTNLNSDASAGGTWTVQLGADWTVQITRTGGTKTPTQLLFLTTQLTGADLGFDSDTALAAGPQASFLAPWRPARAWTSDEPMTVRRYTLEAVESWARSRYNGRALVEKRSAPGGVRTFEYLIPGVAGALAYEFAASIQAYCDLVDGGDWMTAGDPNTPFDRWRDRYLSGAVAGVSPRARVAEDRATPATYDDVVLFVEQLATDVITDMNPEPLLATIRVMAAPWVA